MLLTVQDVAQQLRLSASCIYRMIAAGVLPVVRLGQGQGRLRVDDRDLEEYLAECREQRTQKQTRPTRRPRLQLKHLKPR